MRREGGLLLAPQEDQLGQVGQKVPLHLEQTTCLLKDNSTPQGEPRDRRGAGGGRVLVARELVWEGRGREVARLLLLLVVVGGRCWYGEPQGAGGGRGREVARLLLLVLLLVVVGGRRGR